MSEQAKKEAEQAKKEAEQAKALNAAKTLGADVEIDEGTGEIIWKLSEREREIVRSLSD